MFKILRQNLYKIYSNFSIQYIHLSISGLVTKNIRRNSKNSISVLSYISFLQAILTGAPGTDIPVTKMQRYWGDVSSQNLIDIADTMYDEGRYMDVYELLNRIQYHDNVKILWRICRVLFKMANYDKVQSSIKQNMIDEAYDFIVKGLAIDQTNPQVHKWMAIIMDVKSGQEGIIFHVKAASKVKEHLLKSLELNPGDASVLYMLGYWCYEITSLTWIQRSIATVLFFEPPKASFEEAYEYFLQVEENHPRAFTGNTFMLGKCCYRMGMYYRARYYLKLVADLPAITDHQKKQSEEAKNLAEELLQYDVATIALQQTS